MYCRIFQRWKNSYVHMFFSGVNSIILKKIIITTFLNSLFYFLILKFNCILIFVSQFLLTANIILTLNIRSPNIHLISPNIKYKNGDEDELFYF